MTSIKLACGLAVAAIMLAPAGAAAEVAAGTYSGTLNCAKLPFTKGPQRAALKIQVSGGQASYTRSVGNEDNSITVGSESGSGTIAADGSVTLSGSWRGQRNSFSATYAGKIGASGGKLSGRQNWSYNGQSYTRPCSITLAR